MNEILSAIGTLCGNIVFLGLLLLLGIGGCVAGAAWYLRKKDK